MRKTLIATAAAATMALSTVAASSAPATAAPSTSAPTTVSTAAKKPYETIGSQPAYLSDRYKVGTLRIKRIKGTNVGEVTLHTQKRVTIAQKAIIPFVNRVQVWKPVQRLNVADPKHADYSGHWIMFIGTNNKKTNGCIIDEGTLKHSDYYKERRIVDGMDRQASRRFDTRTRVYVFASQRWSVNGRVPIRTNNPATAATRTWDDFVHINHIKGTKVPTPRNCEPFGGGGGGSW